MYTPLSDGSRRFSTAAYWFATGHWFAQPRTDWTPDFSSDFRDYAARRAGEYHAAIVTWRPSVPDLWTEYVAELDTFHAPAVDTDPTPPHGMERPA